MCRLAGASRAAETARAVQLHRGPLRWLLLAAAWAWPGNGRSNAPTDGGPRSIITRAACLRRDIVRGGGRDEPQHDRVAGSHGVAASRRETRLRDGRSYFFGETQFAPFLEKLAGPDRAWSLPTTSPLPLRLLPPPPRNSGLPGHAARASPCATSRCRPPSSDRLPLPPAPPAAAALWPK